MACDTTGALLFNSFLAAASPPGCAPRVLNLMHVSMSCPTELGTAMVASDETRRATEASTRSCRQIDCQEASSGVVSRYVSMYASLVMGEVTPTPPSSLNPVIVAQWPCSFLGLPGLPHSAGEPPAAAHHAVAYDLCARFGRALLVAPLYLDYFIMPNKILHALPAAIALMLYLTY